MTRGKRFVIVTALSAPEYVDVLDTKTNYRAPFIGHESAQPCVDELNAHPSRVGEWCWSDPEGNPIESHPDTWKPAPTIR